MMVVGLLLAQLVLPGPPSEPIQPPGMICLGECAGPVVWGPAERGRLVVACDMRSDTCSDGRRITTERATPVPCETSPGVWEMVGPNEGCYGVRGLESWAQNTSYLSYGAELDRSPWMVLPESALAPLPGGGYRLCQTGNEHNTGLNQPYSAGLQQGEWATVAVIARPNTASAMLLAITPNLYTSPFLPMTSEGWQRYSYSAAYDGSIQRVYIYPRPGGQKLCIDIIAAWLTKSATPGRPCWGGEAPVTCAVDGHRISTEGWPTESGEISVAFEVGALEGLARYIIDGREFGATTHSILMIDSAGRLRFDRIAGTPNLGPAVPKGKHHVRLRWGDGRTQVFLDGAQVMDVQGIPTWHVAVYLGRRYGSPFEPLNGSISSLRVRSFE